MKENEHVQASADFRRSTHWTRGWFRAQRRSGCGAEDKEITAPFRSLAIVVAATDSLEESRR
jgi:hypothetical protein